MRAVDFLTGHMTYNLAYTVLKSYRQQPPVIACQLMIQLIIALIGFGWVKDRAFKTYYKLKRLYNV